MQSARRAWCCQHAEDRHVRIQRAHERSSAIGARTQRSAGPRGGQAFGNNCLKFLRGRHGVARVGFCGGVSGHRGGRRVDVRYRGGHRCSKDCSLLARSLNLDSIPSGAAISTCCGRVSVIPTCGMVSGCEQAARTAEQLTSRIVLIGSGSRTPWPSCRHHPLVVAG